MHRPSFSSPIELGRLMVALFCLITTVAFGEQPPRLDLRIEQPERWLMESFMSELVPSAQLATSHQEPSTGKDAVVHEREFSSSRAKVQTECQRDRTVIRLNFSEPFGGTIGTGNLATTRCRIDGDKSGRFYQLEVLHNETQCDTQWDSQMSSIFNTLLVRFHPSLETGADLAMNIMCRLSVGDLIVGRRPAKRAQRLKLKQAASSSNKETPGT